MAKEIERKYLVKKNWKKLLESDTIVHTIDISQGYICAEKGKIVRVRLNRDKSRDAISERGYITVKSPTKGISRDEYEYEIPATDAKAMLKNLCISDIITKTRYVINSCGWLWELDVFKGKNAGLVTAEIELPSVKTKYDLPCWIAGDISDNRKYSNSNLSKLPYIRW